MAKPTKFLICAAASLISLEALAGCIPSTQTNLTEIKLRHSQLSTNDGLHYRVYSDRIELIDKISKTVYGDLGNDGCIDYIYHHGHSHLRGRDAIDNEWFTGKDEFLRWFKEKYRTEIRQLEAAQNSTLL